MMVNPPTAWLMMKMGGMEKGDWIIQNSANSGVGRAVIEIAKGIQFNRWWHEHSLYRERISHYQYS